MLVVNDRSGKRYEVGERVAETEVYRLYLCRPEGEAVDYLLQVASTAEHNGALDRAAYILDRLLQEAERLEIEFEKVREDPKHLLNYQLAFPEIVDTFVSAEQGERRINILRFRGVEDVRTIVPLYNLVERDRRRCDLKTSAWIMGKLLKVLVLAHGANVAINDLTLGNILIEPEKHYVIVFNWANAQVMTDGVSQSRAREEIKYAARRIIEVLGGTPEGGIPSDDSEQHALYQEGLVQLAVDGQGDALEAHRAFYALVDSLWPRGYHPFNTKPR